MASIRYNWTQNRQVLEAMLAIALGQSVAIGQEHQCRQVGCAVLSFLIQLAGDTTRNIGFSCVWYR